MKGERSTETVTRAFGIALRGEKVRVFRGHDVIRVLGSDEVPEGEMKIVEASGQSMGIYRFGGTLHAIRNQCPHNGAELCRGHVGSAYAPGNIDRFGSKELRGRVLTCPWHGRQFDIVTGQALYEPDVNVLTYETWEENGAVFVRV